MNVGHECEREGTDSDGHGCVHCRWPRCVTKAKVLMGDVGREYHSTGDKGGQPPKGSHLTGRSCPGKGGGCETNGEVEHADEHDVPLRRGRRIRWAGLTKVSRRSHPRFSPAPNAERSRTWANSRSA